MFIPSTAPRDLNERRLLLLDGYRSYKTTEFIWEYYSNNIHLLFLPLYTSYILQLLDLLVFAPLKRTYRKRLGMLALLNDLIPLGKRNFLEYYMLARKDALTAKNYIVSFIALGL